MPNIRFGVRYTTDSAKDLAYLNSNKESIAPLPGELFINESLTKIYFCESSASGVFKELNPDPPLLTVADTLYSQESAPETSNSTGVKGQMYWNNGYLYICIDTDTWKKIPLLEV